MKFALPFLFIIGSVASAQTVDFSFPDFSLQTRYEKGFIAKSADVRGYVKTLGAKSFVVTNGKPSTKLYAVETSNGCAFDVEVVYKSWPGIDALIISDATCN